MSYKSWRGPYVIDFVKDCGADPTGTHDNGAAWTTAMNRILDVSAGAFEQNPPGPSFTLYVPPGVYHFTDPATIGATFDFLAKVSQVTIQGEPGASIFGFDATPAGSFGAYANMNTLRIADMCFMGLRNGDTTAELDGLWNVNAQYGVVFDRCIFMNLCVQTLMVITQSRTLFRDCRISNCASKNAAYGLIRGLSPSSFEFRRSAIDDAAAYLNGKAFATQKTPVNTSQIVITGECERVSIIDSSIDEGCTRSLKVDGDTNRVGLLEVRGCLINPPVLGGGVATIQAIKCNRVIVDSMRQATATSSVPVADLHDVRRTELNGIRLNQLPAGPQVQADGACGSIVITDCPDITAARVSSQVPVTFTSQGVPDTIPGIQAWYRADLAVYATAGKVTRWTDQSQTGDPNKDAVQAVVLDQPAAPAVDAGLANMLSVVFGADAILQTPAFADPIDSPYTVVVIGYKTAAPANKYFFDSIAAAHVVRYSSDPGAGGIMNDDGTALIGGPNVVAGSLIFCEFHSDQSSLRVNAHTPVVTGPVGAAKITGLTLGNIQSGAQGGTQIAELIVYKGVVSDDDRARLFDYVGVRYGIVIGGVDPNVQPSLVMLGTTPGAAPNETVELLGEIGPSNAELVLEDGKAYTIEVNCIVGGIVAAARVEKRFIINKASARRDGGVVTLVSAGLTASTGDAATAAWTLTMSHDVAPERVKLVFASGVGVTGKCNVRAEVTLTETSYIS